jgi:hypothetical protein
VITTYTSFAGCVLAARLTQSVDVTDVLIDLGDKSAAKEILVGRHVGQRPSCGYQTECFGTRRPVGVLAGRRPPGLFGQTIPGRRPGLTRTWA